MILYAKNNFGPCKLIEYTKDDDKSVAIFQDKEYDFEYTITSTMENLSFDSASFGTYQHKSTDYPQQFIKYLESALENDFNNIEKKFFLFNIMGRSKL